MIFDLPYYLCVMTFVYKIIFSEKQEIFLNASTTKDSVNGYELVHLCTPLPLSSLVITMLQPFLEDFIASFVHN